MGRFLRVFLALAISLLWINDADARKKRVSGSGRQATAQAAVVAGLSVPAFLAFEALASTGATLRVLFTKSLNDLVKAETSFGKVFEFPDTPDGWKKGLGDVKNELQPQSEPVTDLVFDEGSAQSVPPSDLILNMTSQSFVLSDDVIYPMIATGEETTFAKYVLLTDSLAVEVTPSTSVASSLWLFERKLSKADVVVIGLFDETADLDTLNALRTSAGSTFVDHKSFFSDTLDRQFERLTGKTVIIVGHYSDEAFITASSTGEVISRLPIEQLAKFAERHDVDLLAAGCETACSVGSRAGFEGPVNSIEVASRIGEALKQESYGGLLSSMGSPETIFLIKKAIVEKQRANVIVEAKETAADIATGSRNVFTLRIAAATFRNAPATWPFVVLGSLGLFAVAFLRPAWREYRGLFSRYSLSKSGRLALALSLPIRLLMFPLFSAYFGTRLLVQKYGRALLWILKAVAIGALAIVGLS